MKSSIIFSDTLESASDMVELLLKAYKATAMLLIAAISYYLSYFLSNFSEIAFDVVKPTIFVHFSSYVK